MLSQGVKITFSIVPQGVSLFVQSVVSSATTIKDVWDTLAETFGNQTRGHIRQVKYQIKTCVKGTKTINEYLSLAKSKGDDLAFLRKPIDHEDLTEQILAGLIEDYKPEIDAFNS